jgi:hypothetical protein
MSQQQTFTSAGEIGAVDSVTGTNGISAFPSTGSVVVSGINATTSQIGVVTLASSAQAIAGSNTTNAVTPSALTAKLGTQTLDGIPYGNSTTGAIQWTASVDNAVLTTGATGVPVLTALASDGQLIIGSSAGAPAAANITSTGGTIAITNGNNSINLEAIDSGFNWVDVSTMAATMAAGNAYEANNAGLVTLTMPTVASSIFGDTIKIGGFGAGGWIIQCVAAQLIHFGNTATSAGGTLASTNQYDQLEIVCSTTTNEWFVTSSVGNLTPA